MGGLLTYDGDPGTGVWLVPIGALLMLYGVGRTALDFTKIVTAPNENRGSPTSRAAACAATGSTATPA